MQDERSEPRASNVTEWTVSALSNAVKGTVENSFSRVRVRGEVSRVATPSSGHVYLDLKDDRSTLASVIWRGSVGRLHVRPVEGQEIVATGRLTTYARQSKYQLIVEQIEMAGEGAILAAIEKLRRRLEAEGLFDRERKKPLPLLPDAVGVVTSPSGSVIRDILHRIRDRFPRRVLVWPAAVQGAACPGEVVAGIEGFNALPPDGPVPRPEVIIVARGGGSVEDLAGFSDERVVRAVFESAIPVISAIGHETDTALCDHAADVRAPTPTAAAEFAVPEAAQLRANVLNLDRQRVQAAHQRLKTHRLRLDANRASLPRVDAFLSESMQRLDSTAQGLSFGAGNVLERGQTRLRYARSRLMPVLLHRRAHALEGTLEGTRRGLSRGMRTQLGRLDRELATTASRLGGRLLHRELGFDRHRLHSVAGRLRGIASSERAFPALERLRHAGERLGPSLLRQAEARCRDRLASRSRLLETLSYRQTLSRGFSVVRNLRSGSVLRGPEDATEGTPLEIEFHRGRTLTATAGRRTPRRVDPLDRGG